MITGSNRNISKSEVCLKNYTKYQSPLTPPEVQAAFEMHSMKNSDKRPREFFLLQAYGSW